MSKSLSAVGYCDLNINAASSNLKEVVLKALSFGYQTIAINTTVTDNPGADETSKKKGKQSSDVSNSSLIPEPTSVSISAAELQQRRITRTPVILSRLTIIYSDPSRPFLLKCKAEIERYDLIAFTPLTETALKQVCHTLPFVDIISLDMSNYSQRRMARNTLNMAVERDIYFELKYGPCIGSGNPSQMQSTVQLGYRLANYIHGRNIFISSGASGSLVLRAPHDVANLARFMGLSLAASITTVSSVCHDLVACANLRRSGVNKCNVRIQFDEQSISAASCPPEDMANNNDSNSKDNQLSKRKMSHSSSCQPTENNKQTKKQKKNSS